MFNINANGWSAHAAGTSYFLPINDLTFMYINGLLEILNEDTGIFLLDERNWFQARRRWGNSPAAAAGISMTTRAQFARRNDSSGGTVRHRVRDAWSKGMMLQNLGLMAQALGLGGFPNFANHEFGWFQALGFRMGEMPASRYLGAGPLVSFGMKLLRKNPVVPYPLGLERNGEVLLKPFCPPYYASMTDAVRAVVELKFGARGIFRGGAQGSAWSKHAEVVNAVPSVSEAAIAATTAYCEYVWGRYGRFPVYMPPFRTVLGFQACHLDKEFYEKFYRPEA